jgi:hypothetical protein
MERNNLEWKAYRNYVEEFLTRRNIQKTLPTLVWLRVQKTESFVVKKAAFENVQMEVGVLEEMIDEINDEEGA